MNHIHIGDNTRPASLSMNELITEYILEFLCNLELVINIS